MSEHPNSPNGMWKRLGYTINRQANGARIITRPDGSVVDTTTRVHALEDRHEREVRAARLELAAAGLPVVLGPLFHIQSVTKATGKRVRMTGYPMVESDCRTMLSKITEHDHRTLELVEAE